MTAIGIGQSQREASRRADERARLELGERELLVFGGLAGAHAERQGAIARATPHRELHAVYVGTAEQRALRAPGVEHVVTEHDQALREQEQTGFAERNRAAAAGQAKRTAAEQRVQVGALELAIVEAGSAGHRATQAGRRGEAQSAERARSNRCLLARDRPAAEARPRRIE